MEQYQHFPKEAFPEITKACETSKGEVYVTTLANSASNSRIRSLLLALGTKSSGKVIQQILSTSPTIKHHATCMVDLYTIADKNTACNIRTCEAIPNFREKSKLDTQMNI